MAINFGDTIMEGGIAPSVVVQNPVQDDSGSNLANGLGDAFQAVGQIAGSIFKQGQEDEKTKILTRYELDLLDIADDVDQGMSTQEARTRAAVLRREYLGMAPALQSDFDKVWTNFAGANGLGHVVIEGTVEQQAQEAMYTEALKLGYEPHEFDLFQSRARQATELNYQLDTLKAQGGVITETQKLEATKVVVGLADAAFPAAQRQINEARAAIEAGGDKVAITAELNNSLGQSIAQLQHLSGPADSEYITTPITGLLETFNQWSNGSIETAAMEAAINNTQQRYAMMYTLDPTLGPLIAQSKLLNDLGLAQTGLATNLWNAGSLKYLKDILDPNSPAPNLLVNNEDTARLSQNVKQIAANVTSSTDPAVVDEAMQILNSAVDGVWVNERAAKDGALGFKDTVEMLGSPEVKNLINIGGGITAEHAGKFVDILQQNYEREFNPAVQRYWESVPVVDPTSGDTPGVSNIPMNQLLDVVWNGNAVEFVPKQEWSANPRIQALAAEANTGSNSIGIPLNNLINAYANVSGVDAKSIWESRFAKQVFNISDGEEGVADRVTKMLDDQDAQNNTDFTIGDFNPDTLEPIEEYTSQASAIREATQAQLPPIDPAYTNIEGIDYNSYLPSIRASESGGNDSAKNRLSTATGRYQFLKTTWDDLVRRYPNTGLSFEGRLDPNQQEVAIRLFTAENARSLQRSNIPLNNGTLYAAHFLGAGDAAKVLKASSGLVSDYVPTKVIQSNPFLRGMTIAQFKAWANRKGNA